MVARVAIWVSCALLLAATCEGRLYVGYYGRKCKNAEDIVRGVVKDALYQNPGLGAGLIRMAFHDCFVQGCDASVLLDPTPANPRPEKLSPPNFPSLRGFELIDAAKAALEKACPGVVSCADVLAFAARDSAYFLSGYRINYTIPSGRLDGRISLETDALASLPPPFFDLSQLITSFQAKKMNVDDLVILSGAHTIGVSHCSSFTDRLPPNPSNMSRGLSSTLQTKCPASPSFNNDPTVDQDMVTPNQMDNQYYKNIRKGNVLFTSDAALVTSDLTAKKVYQNALYPEIWETKFGRAMVKLSALDLKAPADGEIRRNCRVVNKKG